MTKTAFKSGDRVKLIKAVEGLEGVPLGTIGTVLPETETSLFIRVDFHMPDVRYGDDAPMQDDELELVPPQAFQPGDLVRWNPFREEETREDISYLGRVLNYANSWDVLVDFFVIGGEHAALNYTEDSLEAVPEAASITVVAEEPAQASPAKPARPSVARDLSLTPGSKVILLHLRKRGSISPAEAFTTYNTLRLAPRIFELRQAGYAIITQMREDERGHKYARYSLAA